MIDIDDEESIENNPEARQGKIINIYTNWIKGLKKQSGLMALEKAIDGYEDKCLDPLLDEETRELLRVEHEKNNRELPNIRRERDRLAKENPIRKLLEKEGFLPEEIERVKEEVKLNFYEE